MGLAGFILSTWNLTLDRMKAKDVLVPAECEQKLSYPISQERSEAVFNGECNLFLARWLLKTDGIRHWEAFSGPYGTLADIF